MYDIASARTVTFSEISPLPGVVKGEKAEVSRKTIRNNSEIEQLPSGPS